MDGRLVRRVSFRMAAFRMAWPSGVAPGAAAACRAWPALLLAALASAQSAATAQSAASESAASKPPAAETAHTAGRAENAPPAFTVRPAVPAQKPAGKPKPGTTPPKPTPPPPLAAWTGKYEEARANAKDRNVPILVHILLDAEEASDRYVTSVLEDAELLRKSELCLVILGNNGTHEVKTVEVLIDGEKVQKKVCSAFPMFASCAQHQAMWNGLYADWQEEDGVMRAPQTLVLDPAAETPLLRVNNGQPPDVGEVLANIQAVQAKMGPGLTQAGLEEVRHLLESGRSLIAAASWAEAWKTYAAVLAITTTTVYGQEAGREQARALEGMQKELERIGGLLVPGTAVAAYRDLVALEKAAAGTPLEKETAERVKSAERDRAIREEIAAWRLEVEADGILAQAQDLFAAKQDKQAERLVRKLLGKRYAATPAAAMARKLWPEIAGD